MIRRLEQQPNGDFWEIVDDDDGRERGRFYRAARSIERHGPILRVVDHLGQPTTFTGAVDGIAVVNGQAQVPAAVLRAEAEEALSNPYTRWQRWVTTRAEAQARSVPADMVTALRAREDAAWTEYLAAITAWRRL